MATGMGRVGADIQGARDSKHHAPGNAKGERRHVYAGSFTGHEYRATVDGSPLDPRLDLRNHSPTGFAWGYAGSGPSQLALAILAHHLGDDAKALDLYQDFKHTMIRYLPVDHPWQLDTREINDWLADRE